MGKLKLCRQKVCESKGLTPRPGSKTSTTLPGEFSCPLGGCVSGDKGEI